MRGVFAVLLGGLTAIVTYWGGAIAAVLTMRGIPLGSIGGLPTVREVVVHLALGFAASVLGAQLTIRIARTSPHMHAGAAGLLLGIGAVAGFGKASSQWPPWFGSAMAASCLVGAMAAAVWTIQRHSRGAHDRTA